MWILRVVPIARNAPHRELSYFSKTRVPEASIVGITLRGKAGYGLVTHAEPLESAKQAVRKSSFSLQKVSVTNAGTPFGRPFLRTAFETALFHAASPGSVLQDVTPAAVLKSAGKCSVEEPEGGIPAVRHDTLVLTSPLAERVREYRTLTRESLARGKSVFLIAPTIVESERLWHDVGHGIEDRTLLFHGGLTERQVRERFLTGSRSRDPLLIVGTPLLCSIPRKDLGTIILERENAQNYEREERPLISYKRFVQFLAQNTGARLILAATAPSFDSALKKSSQDALDYGLSAGRLSGPEPRIIPAARKKEKHAFDPVPEDVHALAAHALSTKTPLLLVGARKGAAPLTVCDDCGAVLSCAHCSSPLVLHRAGGARFLCHFCESEVEASVRCRGCDSWRLTTLGIGIERIAESFTARHNARFVLASSDTVPASRIPRVVEEFLSGDTPAIIGTEFIVPYLPDSCADVGVVSVDSLLGIPEYTASERVFLLLAELRSKAKNVMCVATRNPAHAAIQGLESATITSFYRTELAERERFSYPPFVTLLKVSVGGSGASFKALCIHIEELLAPHAPARIQGKPRRKGEERLHFVLKCRDWPDPKLLRAVRALPPSVSVQVNPSRLFD